MLISKCSDAADVVAVRNPDGTTAVVVLNRGDRDVGYILRWECNLARMLFPAHSLSTVVF